VHSISLTTNDSHILPPPLPPPLDSILPIVDLLATYFIIFVWSDELDAQSNGRAAQSRLFQVNTKTSAKASMEPEDLKAYLLCKQH